MRTRIKVYSSLSFHCLFRRVFCKVWKARVTLEDKCIVYVPTYYETSYGNLSLFIEQFFEMEQLLVNILSWFFFLLPKSIQLYYFYKFFSTENICVCTFIILLLLRFWIIFNMFQMKLVTYETKICYIYWLNLYKHPNEPSIF